MIIEFQADEIEAGLSPHGVINVGFYTDGNYLSFQKMIDEERAARLRIPTDTYYVARDDQSYGGYGGLESAVLSPTSFEVTTNDAGRDVMQCDRVKVGFSADEEKFAQLKEQLGQILGNELTVIG